MEIGSLDVFDAAVYGIPHQGTVDFVKEQFTQGWENLTEMGRNFFEEKRELVERSTSDDAYRRTEALARKFRHMWDTDDIKQISTLGGLQQAQVTMQRWLMADPVIREMRNNQLCNGYSETYEDWTPNDIGENHYDYRRVTDGIYIENGEDSGCTSYFESHVNEEDDLTFAQQVDIESAWQTQRRLMKRRREDTTSKLNDRL